MPLVRVKYINVTKYILSYIGVNSKQGARFGPNSNKEEPPPTLTLPTGEGMREAY